MAGEQIPWLRLWYVIFFLLSVVSDHRQDIPAHTYHASFEPNKEWSTFYAAAPEIHRYWKRVVDKYGCMEYVKLRSQVIEAAWDEGNGKWQLKVCIQPNAAQNIILMLHSGPKYCQ